MGVFQRVLLGVGITVAVSLFLGGGSSYPASFDFSADVAPLAPEPVEAPGVEVLRTVTWSGQILAHNGSPMAAGGTLQIEVHWVDHDSDLRNEPYSVPLTVASFTDGSEGPSFAVESVVPLGYGQDCARAEATLDRPLLKPMTSYTIFCW